jgi:hypothetical protein
MAIIKKEINFNLIFDNRPPFQQVDWGVFLSTVIWSYGGFDNMGGMAGTIYSHFIISINPANQAK